MNESIERVPRAEKEAADSYTRLSKWYDRLGRSSEGPHIAEGLRLLDAQPGEQVLEVGFGTGHGLVSLARAVDSTGQVVGIDLAEGMISVAREQVQKSLSCPSVVVGHPDDPTVNRANSNTGFLPFSTQAHRDVAACRSEARGNDSAPATVMLNRGSALHLPYAAASFDAVFSSFMLDLIDTPDIPGVLGEMRRVLKPGGRLGLVSMSKACAGNVVVKVYERFHRWLPQLIDCRPIYLQHAADSAGLRCEVHYTRSMWGIPVEIVVAKVMSDE